MLITGYLLREGLRRWELRRDTAAEQFTTSLTKFKDDDKLAPTEIAKTFTEAEEAIARLQAAQSRYNLHVVVDVLGAQFTLCEAVKRLGGAGRIDKMWRSAAGGKKDRYGMDRDTRNKDEERAERTVTVKEAMANANKASAFAGALRAAVAKGNGTEVPASELFLDENLLAE